MGREVDIPWVVGVNIPCVGGVDKPWIRWVNIPCVGGRYTMGRGRYTMNRGLIYHG